MGTVIVTIGVGDPQGQKFEDLEVVVDTGTTFSTIPRTMMERLGVPVERSAQSELADGSVGACGRGQDDHQARREGVSNAGGIRRAG